MPCQQLAKSRVNRMQCNIQIQATIAVEKVWCLAVNSACWSSASLVAFSVTCCSTLYAYADVRNCLQKMSLPQSHQLPRCISLLLRKALLQPRLCRRQEIVWSCTPHGHCPESSVVFEHQIARHHHIQIAASLTRSA